MEYLLRYVKDVPVPAIVLIFGLIALNKIDKKLGNVPTWDEARGENGFKETKVCDEVHKSIEEKISCIPDMKDDVSYIKGKIDVFLKANGK